MGRIQHSSQKCPSGSVKLTLTSTPKSVRVPSLAPATHDEGRLFGMRATVDRLAELGALRRGLTAEQAAESLWLLSGPEAWNLAQRRKWSLRRYIDWYHRCARAVLLEEAPV